MRACAAVGLFLVVALGGCDVLAPVIRESRGQPPPGGSACDLTERCAQLDEPPPDTLLESEVQAPSRICDGPLIERTIVVDGDVTLPAASFECTRTTLVVALAPGEHPPVPTLHVADGALVDAVISMASDDVLAELDLSGLAIDRTTIEIEGAVRAHIAGGRIAETAVRLHARLPIAAPEVLLDDVNATDLRVDGAGASVRLRDVVGRRVFVDARWLGIERGSLRAAILEGDHVELLDVVAAAVRIETSRFITAGGTLSECHLARCDSATLALTHVARSRFAACAEPLDLEAASLADVVIEGDVSGHGTLIHGGVLGGSSVLLEQGTLQHAALCGLRELVADELDCFSCDPAAPAEVCAGTVSSVVRCPQLCASTCENGAPASSVADSCGE